MNDGSVYRTVAVLDTDEGEKSLVLGKDEILNKKLKVFQETLIILLKIWKDSNLKKEKLLML